MSRLAAVLALCLLLPLCATAETPLRKTDHLFSIERNKNGNYVRYEVRLNENEDLAEGDPVVAYWVLENGRTEDLNLVQKRYAYGILSQERLEKNRFRIMLAALKDRKIIVEKVDGAYRALLPINGIQSILDRVYVSAEESRIGLPKVSFVDVIGRALDTYGTVRERIIPH